MQLLGNTYVVVRFFVSTNFQFTRQQQARGVRATESRHILLVLRQATFQNYLVVVSTSLRRERHCL